MSALTTSLLHKLFFACINTQWRLVWQFINGAVFIMTLIIQEWNCFQNMTQQSSLSLPLFRQSTWLAVTGVAAVTLQSVMTPACPTWSSTASMWSSSRACSTCCSPGLTEPTQTPLLCASSVSLTKMEMPSSTSVSLSTAWVSRERLWVCVL